MGCSSDSTGVGLDSSLAESLRESDLPECCRVEVSNDRLWLLFPESDFVVQTKPDDDADGIHVVLSVAVRAPEPSLETWWDKWSVSTDRNNQAAVVLREILTTRDSVVRMLDERFGGRCRTEAPGLPVEI